jgi:hypothetical protein
MALLPAGAIGGRRLAFVPLLVATHVRRSDRQSVRDSLSCMGECLPRTFDTSEIIRGFVKKLSNGEISNPLRPRSRRSRSPKLRPFSSLSPHMDRKA